jgi:hypothetical protein
LAFSGELVYSRKHTRNGFDDFRRQIESAIERLPQYQQLETARIESWMSRTLTPQQADSLILALLESGVIGLRQFSRVMEEYRRPSFDDFTGPLTFWSFFNRLTTALRSRADQRSIEHASETSRLVQAIDSMIETTARVRTTGIIQPIALEYSGD